MALEGSLQDMSLPDLFQIFRTGAKSGVLLLTGGSERGIIYIHRGCLIDAALVRGSERQILATAEEAVIQLLQWEDATFIFRHDVSVGERPIRVVHDVEWLIVETLKRRENPLRLLPHQEITLDVRLELAAMPSSAESGVNLALDQWRVLSQVAISANLREICERIGLCTEQGIRVATDLVAIGLIEVVQPPKPPVPARASAARQRLPELLAPPPQNAIYAGASPSATGGDAPGVGGRSLLGAIMRRIRGL